MNDIGCTFYRGMFSRHYKHLLGFIEKMTDYVLKVEPANYFVSPYFFILYAEDFLAASHSHVAPRTFSPVEYYLACHSMELSLKAYLLFRGIPKDEIRQRHYGHNLDNILEKCLELGISNLVDITDSDRTLVAQLNEWYSRKGFEYFEIKNIVDNPQNLPNVTLSQNFAQKLTENLKEPCKDEANKP